MDDTVLKIAIAGLLHDIGKLMQRAELEKLHPEIKDNYGDFCPLKENYFSYLHAAHTAYFVEKLIPENLFDKTELYNAARHHKNPLGDIYRDADCISAGMERYSTELDEQNYKDVRLHSIFEEIELQYLVRSEKQGRQNQWIYKLAPSSHDNLQLLYPLIPTGKSTQDFDGDMTYENLWRLFVKEIKEIIDETYIETYFHELLWLLEKYTSCIPSATNVLPDISLYDHAKTTAAIASILYLYKKEHPEGREPFILYTGDISGIQDYIFRISRIQGMGGIAKRLRGRSFYIMMLGEIIARHIIHAAGLTEVNINFCGGGNVELLLPNTDNVRCLLADVEKEINLWLREKYHGTLSFNAAWAMMSADELRTNYVGYRDIISHELEIKKMQRNKDRLHDETFWIERKNKDERITVCRVCNLNLVKAGVDICNSCASDKDIGAFLPKAGYIRFSGDGNEMIGDGLHISFDNFGWVSLFDKGQSQREMILPRSTIYGLCPDALEIKARYHLAQTVPLALSDMELETEEDEEGDRRVYKGQTLSFSTLADMAQGDKRIGVLKMDVDRLGLLFSIGLESSSPESSGSLRSISRIAQLSRNFTLFFTEMVDRACSKSFQDWIEDTDNDWPQKEHVSNIFYLIFSGGDDLVIVGPWDRIIDLAREIRNEFKSFTCQNPNITVSAGIYICKPKFPISAAIEKAEAALKQSKKKGRNRVTVMEETAVWAREHEDSLIYRKDLRNLYVGAQENFFERNEILTDHVYIKDEDKKGAAEKKGVRVLTFEELYKFSLELERLHKSRAISRSFIRSLLKAKEIFFTERYNPAAERVEENHNLMCLPYINYNITRNVKKENQPELKGILITTGKAPEYVRQAYFPCKRALMRMR